MKIEQYKNEVSSLKLSESFKQNLKESMAKEYAAVAVTETPVKPWMKYSKYIATAACLVLIIATVSVVSLMGGGLKVEKSADDANMAQENTYDLDAEDISPAEEEKTANGDDIIEAVEPDVIEADTEEEEIEDTPVTTDIESTESVEEEEDIMPEEDVEDAPQTAPLSAFTPEEYDGEYVTTDYVIGNSTSPEYSALNISRTIETLAAFGLSSAEPEEEEDDAVEEDAVADEEAPAEEEEIEEAAPAESAYKYDDSGISYSELSLNTLRYMDSVNFVRLNVAKVYSSDEAYEITCDEEFLNCKTLYEVNVTYDYINSADLDVTLNLAAYGTSENQLAGRPVMEEGDKFAACLTFDNEGYAEMLEELTYAIYRINGLDVAYHLVGGSGVNPGDTHMGMLDIEREVITTTLNNPAQYTHKAALKELYRYLRRNWTREEYPITDFSSLDMNAEAEEQEQTPTEPPVEKLKKSYTEYGDVTVTIDGEVFDPKGNGTIINEKYSGSSIGTGTSMSRSYVNFKGASIYFDTRNVFSGSMSEISLGTGCELPIKINGVGIGDTMDALIDAFRIRSYVDGKLTLYIDAVNEFGIEYTVTFKVEDNVIVEINIE